MQVLKLLLAALCATCDVAADQNVVLISGASRGIGLAAAKAFHEKGWSVWAGVRQNIPADLTCLENVHLCHLDVTDEALVQAAVDMVLKEEGRLDVLINNAGFGIIGAEECVTVEEAQQMFDVNFFGVLRLTQAVLPTMRKQRSGHILNISSAVGFDPYPGLGLYSASKFALESLSQTLAATLSPWDIKVSVIEPGSVKNDWGKHCVIGSRKCNEEFYDALTKSICTRLSGSQGQTSDEIALLLVAIAENPRPNVRYQTSPKIQEYAAETLIDPTGNIAHEDNLQFIKQLSTASKN